MTNVKEISPSDRTASVGVVWGGMGGESALASNCPVYAFIGKSSPEFLMALAKLLNDELARFPKLTVQQELDDVGAAVIEGVLSNEEWPDKLTVDELAAIRKCIPTKERQREKKLFELARRLLAVGTLNKPDLKERGYAIFQRWWADARLVVRTKSPEESLRAFERACNKAKKPLHDALAVPAYELAMQQLGEAPTWSTGLTAKCVQLGLACRSLQRSSPGEAFFLSARKAADLLEMSHHAQPARWLQLLVTAGVLEVVSAGTARSQKATRYRYIANDL